MLVRPDPPRHSQHRPLLQQHHPRRSRRGPQSQQRQRQDPPSQILSVDRSLAIFLVLAVCVLYIYMHMRGKMSDLSPKRPGEAFHYRFEVLKGYFMQSEEETDDGSFDFIKEKFGLINRTYPDSAAPEDAFAQSQSQWQKFSRHIRQLNDQATGGESIKVLILGRHGQGFHNVAESKYGTAAWDCYYSLLDGFDGITWSDANLTELGKEQARDVNGLWKMMVREHGMERPETFYVSPLTRTIETADLTFEDVEWGDGGERGYSPLIKELLREALGVHTCDRRSTATHISKTFPHVSLEPGFSDADLLWKSDYREPRSARKYRLEQLLDDVFENDGGVFLSLTSHSGAIGSILEAVGHRRFGLQTGGVIPVVVKANRVEGERVKPPKEPSEGPPPCDGPPLDQTE